MYIFPLNSLEIIGSYLKSEDIEVWRRLGETMSKFLFLRMGKIFGKT